MNDHGSLIVTEIVTNCCRIADHLLVVLTRFDTFGLGLMRLDAVRRGLTRLVRTLFDAV